MDKGSENGGGAFLHFPTKKSAKTKKANKPQKVVRLTGDLHVQLKVRRLELAQLDVVDDRRAQNSRPRMIFFSSDMR